MVAYELTRARRADLLRLEEPSPTANRRLSPNSLLSKRHDKTTVMIVDDHAIVCEGLVSLLSSHRWLTVVGQAADGREALKKARQLQPDLVVVDINLPKLSGLALIKALRAEIPHAKTIIFSMHSPEQFAQAIVESGVHGYVCKRDAASSLIKALETVAQGGRFFNAGFARSFRGQPTLQKTPQQRSMTPREREVLVGVAEGLSNKEIAARLGLGVRTIETHRDRLGRKLNLRSAASLTRFALTQGLLVS
jgi:two-component system nitrate/nitrite response regulator NarL